MKTHLKNNILIILLTIVSFSGVAQEKTNNASIEYDRTIKKYFVVEFIPNKETQIENTERIKIQQQHMANIKKMATEGTLVLAGPFEQGGGLYILDAKDFATAEAMIKEDPTVSNNLNTYKIRPWYTEKGLFTLENKN